MTTFDEVQFADLFVEPLRNGIYKAKEFHGRGVPIINMGDLFSSDHLRTPPTATLDVTSSELDRFAVRRGDLLFGRRSLVLEGSGKCSIVEDLDRCVFESSLIRVRLDPQLGDPDYFFAFFSSPEGRRRVLSIASQTAVSGIRGSDLARLSVPVPPLETQRMVGAAIRSFDDFIDTTSERIAVLESLVRTIFGEWQRDPGLFNRRCSTGGQGIDGDSERWPLGVFGDIVEVIRDGADPRDIPRGSVLVGLEHLPRRSTTLTDWAVAEDVGSRRSVFEEGDILFGKIRPYFHKVASAPVSGYCSTDAIIFRPLAQRDSAFALSVASSDAFVAHAVQTSNGTKMPRAKTEVLLRYEIPIPSDSEREKYEAAVGPMIRLCTVLAAQARTARSLRNLLLPALVSGNLVTDRD